MKHRRLFIGLAGALLALVLAQAPTSALRQTGQEPQTPNEQQGSPAAQEKLRKLRAAKPTYRVGYSPAVEVNVQDLADIEIPPDLPKTIPSVRARSARWLAQREAAVAQWEQDYLKQYPGTKFYPPSWNIYTYLKADFQKRYPHRRVPPTADTIAPYIKQFDWQNHILMYVVNQGSCNSCWAFASVAAFECSARLQEKRQEYTSIEATLERQGFLIPPPAMKEVFKFSEQALINCIGEKKADCNKGGWPGSGFDFMATKGLVRAEQRPHGSLGGDSFGVVQPCDATGKRVRAISWGYVTYPPKNPTVAQIKQALLEHGPLAALVRVDGDGKFQAYKGGVFNEHDPYAPNHAILIVGWDDTLKAWRIQNSWGEEWGEQGFMWIAYDSNGVGQYATWVEAPIYAFAS
jgi:cathepsin L